MASLRQIEANRRNALKSTGPRTEAGKQASRANAVRHGLTAETVIGGLEDTADYQAFEAAITADYDAQSVVERELVLRLASLLWRLRRAAAIETGLFEIRTGRLDEAERGDQNEAASDMFNAIFAARSVVEFNCGAVRTERSKVERGGPLVGSTKCKPSSAVPNLASVLARRFLHVTNLPNFALDRLNRYEVSLWRQVAQTLFALDGLDRRKPQERSRRLPVTTETSDY